MYHTITINLAGSHALQTLQGGKQSERSKVKGKISCQRVKTKPCLCLYNECSRYSTELKVKGESCCYLGFTLSTFTFPSTTSVFRFHISAIYAKRSLSVN